MNDQHPDTGLGGKVDARRVNAGLLGPPAHTGLLCPIRWAELDLNCARSNQKVATAYLLVSVGRIYSGAKKR